MGIKIKKIFLFFFLTGLFPLFGNEPWILPLGDPAYRKGEELFLSEWKAPPFENLPLSADQFNLELERLAETAGDPDVFQGIRDLKPRLIQKIKPFAPILKIGFYSAYIGDDYLDLFIPTLDFDYTPGVDPAPPAVFSTPGKSYLDFNSMYRINRIPSLLTAGFQVVLGPWSLLFQPVDLRPSNASLVKDYYGFNLPADIGAWDINFPYRGLITCWTEYVEFRFGRDKLRIGPGKHPLMINPEIPYYDYLMLDFHSRYFHISWYVIRLNPIISQAESEYLDFIDEYPDEHPEDNTHHQKINKERSKYLAVAKFWVNWKWLSLALTQFNLISGRTPQFTDIFPLNIFHNNYDDGIYGCPISVTFTVVPYRGIKIYGEWLLYDLAVADEKASSTNAGGMAWQLGLSWISTPFFRAGPGRLRLDAEWTLVEPWVYGKYYNLRKFTSRFVYVIPYEGRWWVDYPLGFYLGPDCMEVLVSLYYGRPAEWEVGLSWTMQGKGEVDMYGYGDDGDYAHKEDFVYRWSLSNVVQWVHIIKLDGYYVFKNGINISAWFSMYYIKNRFNQSANNQFFLDFGACFVWKIY